MKLSEADGICRYTPHPNGYQAAVRLSEDYATRARLDIDIDEPTVDALQACLLLVIAFIAAGRGKKAYMLLGMAPRALFTVIFGLPVAN